MKRDEFLAALEQVLYQLPLQKRKNLRSEIGLIVGYLRWEKDFFCDRRGTNWGKNGKAARTVATRETHEIEFSGGRTVRGSLTFAAELCEVSKRKITDQICKAGVFKGWTLSRTGRTKVPVEVRRLNT